MGVKVELVENERLSLPPAVDKANSKSAKAEPHPSSGAKPSIATPRSSKPDRGFGFRQQSQPSTVEP